MIIQKNVKPLSARGPEESYYFKKIACKLSASTTAFLDISPRHRHRSRSILNQHRPSETRYGTSHTGLRLVQVQAS